MPWWDLLRLSEERAQLVLSSLSGLCQDQRIHCQQQSAACGNLSGTRRAPQEGFGRRAPSCSGRLVLMPVQGSSTCSTAAHRVLNPRTSTRWGSHQDPAWRRSFCEPLYCVSTHGKSRIPPQREASLGSGLLRKLRGQN